MSFPMLALAFTPVAHALDCTDLDPSTCAAVNALAPVANAHYGATVLSDAATGKRSTSHVYDALLAARQAAEAGGCVVDGTWMAGSYRKASWDGTWSAGDDAWDADGALVRSERRFHGELADGTDSRIGWNWSAYQDDGRLAADTEGGFLVGVWIRKKGKRGVYAAFEATCADGTASMAAADLWLEAELASICALDVRYEDLDGDGHGAGAASISCSAEGLVESDDDCDDADPTVAPGALELCDGQRNDCDDADWSDDAGLASFQDADGVYSDETDTLAAGAPGSPIVASYSNGTLSICEGTWYSRLVMSGDSTVRGVDGREKVVLDGGGVGRVMRVNGTTATHRVEDLTLQNGLAAGNGGGGIYAAGVASLTVERVDFLDNEASFGGGISAGWCGHLEVRDSNFLRNQGNLSGGGISAYVCDEFELYDTVFAENTTPSQGGGVWVVHGSTVWFGSGLTFRENVSGTHGGGIKLVGTGTIEDSTFIGNMAQKGGGISTYDDPVGADITLDRVTFQDNVATVSGGALRASQGLTTVRDCVIQGNQGGFGGAGAALVYSTGTAVFENTDFVDNTPEDIRADGIYDFGLDTTVTCTPAGCL